MSKNVIMYGCQIIRNELRATPLAERRARRKIRMELLNLYDLLVSKHDLEVSDLAYFLAISGLKQFL